MIQKMKKLTFLVTNKEYEQFLTDIRQLGVIHIEELQAGATSEELQAGLALAERYKNAFKVLDYATDAYAAPEVPSSVDIDDATAMNLLDRVEALNADELSLKHQLDAVKKNIAALEPWGDFRWDNFRALEREGYVPTFYVCSSKLFKQEWADKYFATPISEQGGKTYFVTFSAERPDITAEALVLPDRTASRPARSACWG